MANYKSAITFGLVNIPVSLNPVISNNDTAFNQLHKKCMNRVQYIKYCPHCKEDLEQKDIVKAYKYGNDEYVEFSNTDFNKLKSENDKALEIISFVNIKEIDPVYFEKSYYLIADNKNKAFSLFKDALKEEKKVAIIKTILGNKTYFGILRTNENALILTTMYFEEEIKENENEESKSYTDKELELAKKLINNMSGKFKPETYKDHYQDRIKEAIEDKIKGKEIKTVKSKKQKNISNLMDALEESLKRKKK